MAAVTELRAADEVAALRRRVREHLELVGDDEYSVERMAGVVAALDWAEGLVAVAPISGEALAPAPPEVYRESVRAFDAEEAALRRSEPAVWVGAVGAALTWLLGLGPDPV